MERQALAGRDHDGGNQCNMPDDRTGKILLRHRASFALVVLAHRLLTSASWPCARRVGRLSADVVRVLDRRSRKDMVGRRLKEVFPHWTRADMRRLIRDVYRWLFESIVDTLFFHELLANGRAHEHVELVHADGTPLTGLGQGVIFVTGHFGWWEVGCMAMGMQGYEGVVIARKMGNPLIERYVTRHRETHGIRQLPKEGALRGGLKALRDGKNLGILIDQDARRHGVFVDFLGKPASTYTSPARLALAAGVPVAFLYCMREGDSDRFRVIVRDIIVPDRNADRDAEVLRITQRLNDHLSELVREHPRHWLWLHRRWKTAPKKTVPHTPCTMQRRGGEHNQ